MHPLLAVARFQVCLQRAVYRLLGVDRFVYPLAPHARQPELERLGLRRWDGLDDTQQLLRASAAVIFKP